jgi:hypothetical protein
MRRPRFRFRQGGETGDAGCRAASTDATVNELGAKRGETLHKRGAAVGRGAEGLAGCNFACASGSNGSSYVDAIQKRARGRARSRSWIAGGRGELERVKEK